MERFNEDPKNNRIPPSVFTFLERIPGTGKSFIIKTLINITIKLTGKNSYTMTWAPTWAPTGCAAALIDGTTHCRCRSTPVGTEYYKTLYPITIKNAEIYNALKK